ncbi:NADP-dependent oxidoreductase [Herbiconiux moechotypicola]|nr:NADP-dependent oxidoreductase [Herbiconiux moechotypicola]MCS5731737.1 NADP-dependent oxidoreductase [Herbiconiux moechotypicola]
MSAAVIREFGAPEVLEVTEVPTPVRINAEVLVKVAAAGVNPIDAKTRAGGGVAAAVSNLPCILGYDFAGVVVEAPYAGHPLTAGDEVYGMTSVPRGPGSYAEYLSVPSLQVTRAPKTLSLVEAAGVPLAALTAWGLVVDLAKAHEGQKMLIHAGSGGVGHFAVQFAAYFGARVTATASSRNQSWLRELGATTVIDYTATRFEEVLSDFDVVIDLVGNTRDETGSRSLRVLRPGGLIVNAPTGSWPGFEAEAAEAGMRATTFKVAPDASTLAVIARLIDSGDVRVHVDEVYPLSDAAEAHRALELGHTRGKLVLQIGELPF